MLAIIIAVAIVTVGLLAIGLASMGTRARYRQQREEIARLKGRKVYSSQKYSFRK